MNHKRRSIRAEQMVAAAGLLASVVVISGLHYLAGIHTDGMHAVLVHETLKRLYYVPIVIAAIHYGVQGGLATALLSSAMYLPHIMMSWSGWPVFEIDKYAEIALFNVVGAVTGMMADRLRSERNRYREIGEELEIAYHQLEASAAERIKAERMATVGRVAAEVAHEIRTPLAAILGCFEILAGDYRHDHPKQQFIEILKKEIARAENVVTTFLDLAQPAPPRRRPVDLNEIARNAARRFVAGRGEPSGPAVCLTLSPSPITVAADADQVERGIVELLITTSSLASGHRPTVAIIDGVDRAEIHVRVDGVTQRIPDDMFESFDEHCGAHALMLPLVRRLLDNQGGSVTASVDETNLDVTVGLPRFRTAAVSAALPHPAATS